LTQEESETLVSYLLDIDDLPDSAKNRILERSEGNPFFLEEIVRRLIDERVLVRRGERWAGTEGLADISVPDTVQAVILARLDLLSAPERYVIQQAGDHDYYASPERENMDPDPARHLAGTETKLMTSVLK
jgi:adenylate cyclase